MAINFPNSPSVNETFAVGSSIYQWDGTVWRRNGSLVTATMSTSQPSSPTDGDLWFKTDTLDLYIYYDDGSSQQWIQVSGGGNDAWIGGDSGLYYNGPLDVGIGTTTPRASLDVAKTDAIVIPVGTNAQQPSTPAVGMIRVNSSNGDILEVYGAGSWQEVIKEFRGQRMKNKTLEGPTKFETQTTNWSGNESLNSDDGIYLEVTLTGNVTLADSFDDGENQTLQITDADSASGAYTITWPTITWFSGDGAAPTLQDSDDTLVSVWKAGTTLYGFAANGA